MVWNALAGRPAGADGDDDGGGGGGGGDDDASFFAEPGVGDFGFRPEDSWARDHPDDPDDDL